MKATGIVRRIDDLGRVVIPKEIRRTMRIREGDPLEIYTSSDGEVIFKKYSPIGEMGESAAQVAEIMHRLAGCPVAVFDRDHVVSVSGAAKRSGTPDGFHRNWKNLWSSGGSTFPMPASRNFYPQRAWKRRLWHACPFSPPVT